MKKLIFFIFISVFLISCNTENQGQYNTFAQCLSENDVTMYGTSWCSHCQNQKASFGPSFNYVHFVDCDVSPALCAQAGVEGFPTWVINGEIYPGVQPLYRLSELSGCQLVEDA